MSHARSNFIVFTKSPLFRMLQSSKYVRKEFFTEQFTFIHLLPKSSSTSREATLELELLLVLRLYCAVFLSIVTCEAAAGWTSVCLLPETLHPVTSTTQPVLPTFYRVTFHCTAQLTNSFFTLLQFGSSYACFTDLKIC